MIETGPKYKYSAISVWDGSVSENGVPLQIRVDVDTRSDCHLWLNDGTNKKKNGYEIVIGGWNNTRSEIRRGQQGDSIACCLHKSNPLSRSGSSRFWVSVIQTEEALTIVVGFGWEIWKDKFLIAVDRRRRGDAIIRSLSVSTGFGHSGVWNVYVNDIGGESRILATAQVEDQENKQPEHNEKIAAFRQTPKSEKRPLPLTPMRETLVTTTSTTNGGSLLKRPRTNEDDVYYTIKRRP